VESRESIVKFLRGLGYKDLVEIFYDVVRDRSTGDVADAKGHYIIANVATEDGTWTLEVIAREDPERYPSGWAPDVPVCQSGVCEGCGSQVRSWAKHMLCPVCGGKAYVS